MKDTELKEIRDNVAIIFVIHEFYAEWLNSNYKEVIQTIMKDVIGYEVEPKFFTAEQLAELDETSRKSNTPSEPQRQIIEYGHEGTDQFNTHNTFDTFVIGPGNRFPHASLAVAEAPHKHTILYLYMVALVLVRHILCMRSVIMFLAINQMLKYYILQVKNSQMTSSNQFVTMNLKPLEKSIETSTCY